MNNRCLGCSHKTVNERLCPTCRENWEHSLKKSADTRIKPLDMLDSISYIAYYDKNSPHELVNKLILTAKKREDRNLFDFLSFYLSEAIKRTVNFNARETIIINVPRSNKNAFAYGFDQTKYLSLQLSRRLGVKYINALYYIGDNIDQKRLNHTDRHLNAEHNYGFKPPMIRDVVSRRCILVDDVCTTGATLSSCAELLYKYGAKYIDAAVVAVAANQYKFT